MGSPANIDLEALLAPISEESPAGEDLRADSSPTAPYHTIKGARRDARAEERPKGQDEGEAGERREVPDTRAHWRPVLDQGQELLAEHSKDLEIAAWLTEALVRFYGFSGLRDAFTLTREIVERYWDECYPAPDLDEPEDVQIEERVAQLAGLNGVNADGTLMVPMRNVPITEDNGEGCFATWHVQQASAVRQIVDPEVRQRRIDAGAVSLEEIEAAGRSTSEAFFRTIYEDLCECIDEFAALTAAMEERCGEYAPPASTIRRELEACLDALKLIAKSGRGLDLEASLDDESEGEEEGAAEGTADGASAPGSASGAVRSRDDALRELQKIADFFRRTEPHSPVPYAIEQAVRWGRMPLPELLGELIDDEAARSSLFRLAGIKDPSGSDSEYSSEYSDED